MSREMMMCICITDEGCYTIPVARNRQNISSTRAHYAVFGAGLLHRGL